MQLLQALLTEELARARLLEQARHPQLQAVLPSPTPPSSPEPSPPKPERRLTPGTGVVEIPPPPAEDQLTSLLTGLPPLPMSSRSSGT